jgi:hypothetical protein
MSSKNISRPSFGNQILKENAKKPENDSNVKKLFYKINNTIIKPKMYENSHLENRTGKIF